MYEKPYYLLYVIIRNQSSSQIYALPTINSVSRDTVWTRIFSIKKLRKSKIEMTMLSSLKQSVQNNFTLFIIPTNRLDKLNSDAGWLLCVNTFGESWPWQNILQSCWCRGRRRKRSTDDRRTSWSTGGGTRTPLSLLRGRWQSRRLQASILELRRRSRGN